jgi:eukaryotic-like serine/threonine-protein kinase
MTLPLASGTKLGRYEIRSKIGEGGMGEVYLAQDTELDRTVAIKILPQTLASNQDHLQRFIQEAKAASGLNHPHILTIHEIGATQNSRFIATEFIDGETLRQHILATMKLAEVLDVAIQAGGALAAAHGAGIIHRDIKPENIMIRRDGIVKVLDFGLAKLTADNSAAISTQAPTRFKTDPGKVVGTVTYMSPEQARGIECDARTDVFSLGVVIYEMVTGHLPFAGSTSSDVVASILSEKEPQPLARYSREVPAELERIVSKALRKNRDQRYQTIKDMLLDLQHLKDELEFKRKLERSAPSRSKSAADVDQEPVAETVVQSAAHPTAGVSLTSAFEFNKRTVVVAVAAFVMIALAIGGYFYFTRTRGETINSIAVLPFVNASGNPDAEYLSDGITESLINTISQLPHLKVMSRNSVFRYKGRDADAMVVGRDLGVQRVLTGRVTQHGDALSISVELINAGDNSQVWGQHYDRKLSDIFTTQNEIATEISEKLRLPLSGEDQKRVTKHYTDNVEAYQLYLKGNFEANKFTPEALEKGITYFNQAIAIDPTYALAYAGLSDLYISQAHVFVPPREGYAKAKWAAEKAAQLDDALAEAHQALGSVKLYSDWDFPAAEKEFRRAIELNPNYSEAHSNLSCKFKALRRYPEEIAEARRGQELDPLSAFANMELGEAFYQARRYDEAIEQIRKTVDLDPYFFVSYHVRARAYEQKKMYAEAIADCQEWMKIFPDDPNALATLAHVYATMGRRREAEETINKLQEISKQRYFSPYWIAVAYAGLGDNDQAFHYFEKAFEDRYFLMIWMNSDPRFDNIRSDPRFVDLVQRMRLAQ